MSSHPDRVRRNYTIQPGAVFRRMPVAGCRVTADLKVDEFSRCLGAVCSYFDNGDAYVQTLGWVDTVADSGKLGPKWFGWLVRDDART